MFFEPLVNIEKVELLRPKHARQRLSHHECFISTETWRCDGLVKLISFSLSSLHDRFEIPERVPDRLQAQIA